MARSPAFARIKADVLRIVAAIPKSKVTTHRSIGQHLDVVPRHVAYILATLTAEEKISYPWYRVVSHDASLGVMKRAPDGTPQSELLSSEGHVVAANAIQLSFERTYVAAEKLKSGVKPQIRATILPSNQRKTAKRGQQK
jgi:methylated-DNA-protein-cysteine methyltransferase related protein